MSVGDWHVSYPSHITNGYILASLSYVYCTAVNQLFFNGWDYSVTETLLPVIEYYCLSVTSSVTYDTYTMFGDVWRSNEVAVGCAGVPAPPGKVNFCLCLFVFDAKYR